MDKKKCGFTLLEVLIVLTVISIVASVGLFFSMEQYRQTARMAEISTITTLLERARNAAMVGATGLPHGVAFNPQGSEGYILFFGRSYAASASATREFIPFSYPLQLGGGSSTEVVFSTRAGTTSPGTLTFSDPETNSTHTISINYEGLIE